MMPTIETVNTKDIVSELKANLIFQQMEVEGMELLFGSIGELVSAKDGGVNDDDLVDVWAKCVDNGVVYWGVITVWKETLEVYSWDFKESVIEPKTA